MRILVMMLVLLVPTLSFGDQFTGSEIVDKCRVLTMPEDQRTKEQSQDLGFCLGYIAGLTDADRTFTEWNAKGEYICLQGRDDAGLENLVKVVTKDLQDYPQDGENDAANFILNTLWRNFSCGF